MSELGLACTSLTSSEHADGAHTLIEIDGFVAAGDPRLDGFRAQLGKALHRVLRLGSYAVPLPAAVFAAVNTSSRAAAPAEAIAAAKA